MPDILGAIVADAEQVTHRLSSGWLRGTVGSPGGSGELGTGTAQQGRQLGAAGAVDCDRRDIHDLSVRIARACLDDDPDVAFSREPVPEFLTTTPTKQEL